MNSNDRGFTLVELMISMAVGLVVLGAIYAVFTVQNMHLTNQEQLASAYQNARIAMEMMCREISMAGYNQTTGSGSIIPVPRCTNALVTAGTPCVGITDASADTISFTTDLNGNGDTTSDSTNPSENITFSVYSSSGVPSLGRTSNGTKQPVVEYVEALSFAYEDGSGNPPADLSAIRRVKITIRTRSAKEDTNYTDPDYGDHYRRYTLTSYAIPRNLKY